MRYYVRIKKRVGVSETQWPTCIAVDPKSLDDDKVFSSCVAAERYIEDHCNRNPCDSAKEDPGYDYAIYCGSDSDCGAALYTVYNHKPEPVDLPDSSTLDGLVDVMRLMERVYSKSTLPVPCLYGLLAGKLEVAIANERRAISAHALEILRRTKDYQDGGAK